MSFFGFDTSMPADRGHPSKAPGFGVTQDPFAGLSRSREENGEDANAIDFEDTYDGLGDQLDEAGDAFNDDTFGSGGISKPVDKDFDFFGQTAKVADAITEEQLQYSREQPSAKSAAGHRGPSPKRAQQPIRTGYEKYRGTQQVSDLQVDPRLWGAGPPAQRASPAPAASAAPPPAGRRMLSLEEVEAQMRAQAKKPADARVVSDEIPMPSGTGYPPQMEGRPPMAVPPPQTIHQPRQAHAAPQAAPYPHARQQTPLQAELPVPTPQARQILQRPQHPPAEHMPQSQQQTKQRQTGHQPPVAPQALNGTRQPPRAPAAGHQSRKSAHVDPRTITHPGQIMQLTEEERAAYLEEEAKRAKRNHKIFLLSKANGLMTPQDKNFITRIQLQQLMQAAGNADTKNPDAAMAEDFYYQVFSQIRSGRRQNPHQPLNHFAQTYLFQTGSRHGGRRNNRGENHMQRMEQQVARAVEAAKQKPKNTQLVVEGSLGKIAFSSAKAPRATLNIKPRPESSGGGGGGGGSGEHQRTHSATRSVSAKPPAHAPSARDAKTALRHIETVYTTLMRVEDAARAEPPPPPTPDQGGTPEIISQLVAKHEQWAASMQSLTEQLWQDMQVLAAPPPAAPHPFIAMLAHPKGAKLVPRAFRFLAHTQRLTACTALVLHLGALDAVRLGSHAPGDVGGAGAWPPPPRARAAVELFSAAVLPCLFAVVSEAPLFHATGLLGLLCGGGGGGGGGGAAVAGRVAHSRVGLAVLTMLASRATLVREAGQADEAAWAQWAAAFDRLFDALEPVFGDLFPMPISAGEDMYVWQFLAAVGSGASPEQQSRLVIAVKDRVMETVSQSKTLPPDMASQRLANVNLFMRAIGLDVELLG